MGLGRLNALCLRNTHDKEQEGAKDNQQIPNVIIHLVLADRINTNVQNVLVIDNQTENNKKDA